MPLKFIFKITESQCRSSFQAFSNCFISCIGKKSAYRNVFDAFLNRQFILCLSTEILLEYEEKFTQFWGEEVTANLLGTMLTSSNISLHDIFYNFLLVAKDSDDNKFADTYIAAGADILISNDAALLALNNNKFPSLKVITLQQFSKLLIEQK